MPQSWNAYTYVSNNPVNLIDPDGLYPQYVHYGYSYVAARRSGYSYWDAHAVAAGSASVDAGATSPFTIIGGPEIRREFHAFYGDIPEQEIERKRDHLSGEVGRNRDHPWLQGRALHPLQDSFSHEGFEASWGHLWAGHDPDRTSENPERAVRMQRVTEESLRQQCISYNCQETAFFMLLAKYNAAVVDECPPNMSCQYDQIIQVDSMQNALGLARALCGQGGHAAIDGLQVC